MSKNTFGLVWTIAAASLLGAASPDSVLAQSVSFNARRDFRVGVNPQSVAVADLNGDGRADMVVANHDDNTISVLIGRGDGTA